MWIAAFELCKGEEFQIGLRSCSIGSPRIQKHDGLGMITCVHCLERIARLKARRLRT
jgi:hypothetical protein